jgi:hypothetical protein
VTLSKRCEKMSVVVNSHGWPETAHQIAPRAFPIIIGGGENVLACLEKFARDNDLQNGIVSSFVGDIENVETVVGRVHGWFP